MFFPNSDSATSADQSVDPDPASAASGRATDRATSRDRASLSPSTDSIVATSPPQEPLSYPVQAADLFRRLNSVKRHQARTRPANYSHTYSSFSSSSNFDGRLDRPGRSPYTARMIAIHTVTLFLLGAFESVLLANLDGRTSASLPRWQMVVFWGALAAITGSVLPWIDPVEAGSFRGDQFESGVKPQAGPDVPISEPPAISRRPSSEHLLPLPRDTSSEWTLAIRSIGVFLGILYAVRKLSWPTAAQASVAVSAINMMVWYLLDRSITGFALNSFVATTGSAFVLLTGVEIVPPPSTFLAKSPLDEVSVVSQIAIEDRSDSGLWVASVLFCSSICFGMAGRIGKKLLTAG